jgi:hypothetical protein
LTSHNNIIRKQSTFINCSNDKYCSDTTGICIIRRNKLITIEKIGNKNSINIKDSKLHLDVDLGLFDHHKIVKDAINFKNQQVSDSSIERFPEDRIEMPIITKDLSILNIVKSFINYIYISFHFEI